MSSLTIGSAWIVAALKSGAAFGDANSAERRGKAYNEQTVPMHSTRPLQDVLPRIKCPPLLCPPTVTGELPPKKAMTLFTNSSPAIASLRPRFPVGTGPYDGGSQPSCHGASGDKGASV